MVRTRYRVRNFNGMERIMASGKFSFWRRNDRSDRYDRYSRYDSNNRYDRGRSGR
jgi:hypothetical protein